MIKCPAMCGDVTYSLKMIMGAPGSEPVCGVVRKAFTGCTNARIIKGHKLAGVRAAPPPPRIETSEHVKPVCFPPDRQQQDMKDEAIVAGQPRKTGACGTTKAAMDIGSGEERRGAGGAAVVTHGALFSAAGRGRPAGQEGI